MLRVCSLMNRTAGNFLDLQNSCREKGVPLFADVVARRDWITKDRVLWEFDWARRYPNDYFVFVDPWDSLFVGTPEELEGAVRQHDLLLPADKNVGQDTWPALGLGALYDQRRPKRTPWNFVNGAGPSGKGEAIAEAIRWGLSHTDYPEGRFNDASFWVFVFLEGGYAHLDQECAVTQQLYNLGDDDLGMRDGRIVNLTTNSKPQFLHANGHSWHYIPTELIPKRGAPRL